MNGDSMTNGHLCHGQPESYGNLDEPRQTVVGQVVEWLKEISEPTRFL